MLQPRLYYEGNCHRMPFRSFVLLAALLLSSTLVSCQESNQDEEIESSRIKREGVPENRAFNTNGIVYDNTPWRPGRDMDLVEKESEEDERRLKNLATRIMSNGVEVLVKDKNPDGKQEQTKYMEVKTIQPSAATNMFMSSYPKIDKRIDSEEDENNSFDLIQPSEVSNSPCTSSCSCSNTKTEVLQTRYSNGDYSGSSTKYGIKTTYGATKIELRPTNKESMDKKTAYGPYEYETNSQLAPTDKVVEKYTEVINDYSDEKDSNSVEESELLTNEQAPIPPKTNKVSTKVPEKIKPDKPQKPNNKNKFVVADLLKLGTLGIKGLTQLAPVIEKMTGGFIKRQDTVNKTTTTTIKPAVKLTAYTANKRVDNDLEAKHSNFPIYIPVDELETSESQLVFTNATLHQNLAWAAEHKQPKAHIVPPKMVHESPLVNGGIPISPGEIITANSDVIVGKPAVGGPLTLAASGIKLQNSVNPPPIDSFIAANEQYFVNEKPLGDQPQSDDSYDLRPPEPPQQKSKPNRPIQRPIQSYNLQNAAPNDKYPYHMPASIHDHIMKTEQIKNTGPVLGNHGRPAFLDYIPSLAKPTRAPTQQHINYKPVNEANAEVADNSPSSSEVVNTQIRTEDGYTVAGNTELNKPFLVDIQPSRVANVLIPHGSSTALVFAGSSEPHKTGDYIDDPLPYPEPGYFGSFSIDAPQMTNVHNVAPNSNKQYAVKPNAHPPLDNYKPNLPPYKDQSHRNDLKIKWKDNKRPIDYNKIPPPTSNQETHVQVGPQITVYDPEVYNPTGANGEFDKYNQVRNKDKQKDGKDVIDKEYENFLAVPPPPQQSPQKQFFNQDSIYDKSKPYSSRPIVHTKPVQDMKVFLNIQHPVPEQMPPKVTSEIYFAAQMPNSKPTPTYTIRIPPASPNYNNFNKPSNNMQPSKANNVGSIHNSFSVISSPNMANKSFVPKVTEDKDNTYTVTLNTATNVASNNEAGQVIGSSVAVPVGTPTHVSQINTDIPIGTNFAIRVEDNTTPLETYNLQGTRKPPIVFNENGPVTQISVGDNRWNKSSTDTAASTIIGSNYYNQNSNYGDKKPNYNQNQNQANKNANFGNNQNYENKQQNYENNHQSYGSQNQNSENNNQDQNYSYKPQNHGTNNQHYGNQGILIQNYPNKNQNHGILNLNHGNKKQNQGILTQNHANKNQNHDNLNQNFANNNQNQVNVNKNFANQNQKNQGILSQNQGILNQNQGILNQNQGILNQNQGIINQNYENKKQNLGNVNQNYASSHKNYESQNQNPGTVNQNQDNKNENQGNNNKNQGNANQNYATRNPNQGIIDPNYKDKQPVYDNKQQNYENKYQNYGDKNVRNPVSPSIPPSLNSHANFPMMNDYSTSTTDTENVKPVTEFPDNIKSGDIKRPAKLIPNIPTNSHGWYSSVLKENNINNIKVEATTRKIIPLIHDYNEKNNSPQFGQKITSAGKPPNEFWTQNAPPSGFNIGKPFSKPQSTEKPFSTNPPYTPKPFNINYIPSNFGGIRQPAYDIPIRDNSDETTTTKSKHTTDKIKPVYENSEEIYDGEEESENPGEVDGEVSSESMKVPVVSSSSEVDNNSKTSTELTLLQDEVLNPPKIVHKEEKSNQVLVNFNPGTQTEKPFSSNNKTTFQSNIIKPIRGNNPFNKPRPFTINTAVVLDHQLQQPHWQINHMLENVTNASYEDNIDLNIGEEMDKPSTYRPSSSSRPVYATDSDIRYKSPPSRPFANRFNNTHVHNESIITSTVHIQDKKPLIVEKATEKTTLPTFTLSNLELNRSSSEIIDLSPPPPTMDYNFKPSTNDEMIMGMSPPPPARTPPGIRLPTRVPLTPRPVLPIRTPPPYRTKPPRPIPPRVTTQRPIRKPINRDEVSTYRPAFDILNNMRRPAYNRDQPSSQLLPPPRDIPSRVVNPIEFPAPSVSVSDVPNVVFPTPISSGWLTSSDIDPSSSFSFNPTSIQFPETPEPSRIPDSAEVSSSENSYSYEAESSSERVDEVSYERPVTEIKEEVSKESSTESTSTTKLTPITETNDSEPELSQEETTTDKMKIIPLGNKNRTRKPYPVRIDDKKPTTNKFKLPPKSVSIIKPTRTISRPEILYPTRQTSTRKIVRPITRVPPIIPSSIIESSETSVEEDFIKPTEVLKEDIVPTVSELEITRVVEPETSRIPVIPSSMPTPSIEEVPVVQPVHHAGNEVKISDEVIPTKTEFRTTVVTFTKTLSEPPKTVSSIGFVNITHTLTVTHTKTSLVSQSEGAVTQTLVLTNTQTSTIVDVVTEVQTQVQPTTIIETVTKHIPIQVEPTPVQEIVPKTKVSLDDITMSSEEHDNLIIRDQETTDNIIQKIENENEPESDNDTFFVVMNKSQNGGPAPPLSNDVDAGDYVTRNEQVNNNGVSQVLFGEILLAGTPYLETTNVNPNGVAYGKECQPDCKASRNERCQRIDGIMKCVCRPGFARMFPDRPCKPTYTYSVKLALGSQGTERLEYQQHLSDNSSKEYHALAVATHEGINRMIMQSDLRDVYHGVHITGFHPVELKSPAGDLYQGVINDFYVQLSDNAHESRLKEVIEKYLRNNNYSLGGTEVHAASELMDKLDVSDFDECISGSFHDCSEHAQCFNLRGTYTCSCLEGFADLSVNALYPGRICSAEPVGCERCNYHGACYSRDDRRVLCECFQWYTGSSCQINLKGVLISLVVFGAILMVVLAVCAVLACSRRARRAPRPQRSIVACIQSMPSLHQGAIPKQRQDRRALISERGESGDNSSLQNASLPYIPTKRMSSGGKKCVISDPPAHDPPPPPAPAVMIPRARLHPHHGDSRENIARKRSLELSSEAKLISYLESGATSTNDEMRRKHSLESSYSTNKDRHNKQGALVSAGFKVSTTIRPDESAMKDDRDDMSSVTKGDLEAELSRFDTLRKSYSQEDLSEWTDAERRLGELTLSEARSVGGTLPASTGRAASSTRLTHQEHTMAERDLGSTFLLPHVHLYKPDLTSDVSEFDSL